MFKIIDFQKIKKNVWSGDLFNVYFIYIFIVLYFNSVNVTQGRGKEGGLGTKPLPKFFKHFKGVS